MVTPFTLTIHDQIRLIREVTAGGKPVTFRALVQRAAHRLEVIVTLLAVLELIKRRQVVAGQSSMFGEIEIIAVSEITDNGATDFTD
jgi:chromatin segregation and condensation protein Rec8/ScpA/Scc1 (kleisin family)